MTDSDAGDRPLAVLVVEDEYFIALATETLLSEQGIRITATCQSGADALAAAARDRPDLAIVDVRLDGPMDGIETAARLAEMGVRAIFATAHCDDATRARAAPSAPLGWLVKPYTDPELLDAVRAARAQLGG